jgi:DNA-directed RNA polymerase subunit H (RpoH/RPB5)
MIAPKQNEVIYSVIFNPESTYCRGTADFNKLIDGILAHSSREYSGKYLDIILINKEKPSFDRTENISSWEYHTFTTDLLAHRIIPKVELASQEELSRRYMVPESLPHIKSDDPLKVWLGLRPGSIIKILYASAIAGRELEYRIVK